MTQFDDRESLHDILENARPTNCTQVNSMGATRAEVNPLEVLAQDATPPSGLLSSAPLRR